MAGGRRLVAALRHRPRQAVLVVLLAAVVSASAALGPLYARAVEQSVLKNVLADDLVARSSIAGHRHRRGPTVAAGAGDHRARPDP